MTIEATLERIATTLESLLIVAAANPSLPSSIREVVSQGLAPASDPQINTSAQQPAQAPPSKPVGKKRTAQAAPSAAEPVKAPADPAVTAAEPVKAPADPAVASPAPSQPTVAERTILQTATDAVIALANDFSRDEALAILRKRRGVTRCSELKPEEVQGVLDEARAAYTVHLTAKSSASLI